ncbi:hypothetical protein [Asinibacterium sp. OR53]|uniref:baeRF3 domain-containing protein n=1 Tax=Asinibacterium sp. OR53 TaxID=925409 RepID=UPI00047A7722|nr:hypothetical protein [Asinibacterium sp. OR53]
MNRIITPKFKYKKETKAGYYHPAVSVTLPFEPKMNAKAELYHSLNNAASCVEHELRKSYSEDIVKLMLQKLQELIGNLNFSTNKKSIVIYVSPVFEKVLYLDIAVESKIIVDDSFDIRKLVYNKKTNHQFLALQINGKESKMYLGDSGKLIKIMSDSLPSVYEVYNDIPERVANFTDIPRRRETIMDKFLHHIDNTLDIILHSYHQPLFVMGVEKMIGHFKSITKHSNFITDYIYGNYEDANIEQLYEILRPYTDEWEKVTQKNLISQLEAAADKKKLATGIRDVWKEAINHKGRLLIVEKDYKYTDRSKNSSIPTRNTYNKFSPIKNPVDNIIEKVLESGGDVEFVEKNALKNYQHIALVCYY